MLGFKCSPAPPKAAANIGLKVGDQVVGATFFGAYSSRVLIPSNQVRKIPIDPKIGKTLLTLEQAAALPAVSVTAIHALQCAGKTTKNTKKYEKLETPHKNKQKHTSNKQDKTPRITCKNAAKTNEY